MSADHTPRSVRCLLGLVWFSCMVPPMSADLAARVVRVEILERAPFAQGMPFGTVGAYERIRGRLHYAVDPRHPRNAAVVDLKRALEGRLRADVSEIAQGRIQERLGGDPRNASGEVEFSGDFLLLKPVDLSRGNHRLLYGVTNRGTPLMLAYLNSAQPSSDPTTLEHAGNGWLMREGYSLLWTAWNWDVEKVDDHPLRINLPVVVDEAGEPLKGTINAELEVVAQEGVRFLRLAWGGSRCYPVAAGQEQNAVLTVRDAPDGGREVIERSWWSFARIDAEGRVIPDPYHVHLPSGFEKGRIYELVYTAAGPRVVGLGLAAVRDAISFFRFETRDRTGQEQPLALAGKPDPQYAYIFGLSQSARFITHMIYQGFHLDEQDRMVFDGALPLVGGGGKGGFNFRWAQTTHHPKHLEGNSFPADFFPFNYTEAGVEQYDPLGPAGRRHGDVLAAAKREGKIPKILICNHELEYWTRSASLVHTSVDGTADITPHPNVRVYMINGTRHGSPGGSRFSPEAEHSVGQIDQRPVARALVRALDRWVSHGVPPPASRVPRVAAGELLTAGEHAGRFPQIPALEAAGLTFPGVRHPGRNLQPPRLDYGPRFWTEGIQDLVPPVAFGPRYRTLVPAFDADGNGIGGIRLPDLAVPLGTYQGFNPRRAGTGAEDYLTPFLSSFWPFAISRQERLARGDGRLSIEERYPSQSAYVERVRAAAWALEAEGFLLEEDVLRIVDLAESLEWPPVPTDGPPYWRVRH